MVGAAWYQKGIRPEALFGVPRVYNNEMKALYRSASIFLALIILLAACAPGAASIPGPISSTTLDPTQSPSSTPTLLPSPTATESQTPTQTLPADPAWVMMGKVDRARALADVRKLSGEEPICSVGGCVTVTDRLTGSKGLEQAKEYVRDQLVRAGYSPEFENWILSGYDDQNIIASKPGSILPDEQVYVVAHLDGVRIEAANPYPAADDNASGVAALLELARIAAGQTFDRTLVLVFSTGEEQGELGIKSHLDALTSRQRGAIKAVLNVDMIGYDSNGDAKMELWYGSQQASLDLSERVAEVIREYPIHLLPEVIPGCYCADEVAFRKVGLAATHQIENFYDGERNPYYHTSGDTLEHMSLDYWMEQVKAVVVVTASLAGTEGK